MSKGVVYGVAFHRICWNLNSFHSKLNCIFQYSFKIERKNNFGLKDDKAPHSLYNVVHQCLQRKETQAQGNVTVFFCCFYLSIYLIYIVCYALYLSNNNVSMFQGAYTSTSFEYYFIYILNVCMFTVLLHFTKIEM